MIKFSISSYEYGLETYTCFEVEESIKHVKNYFRLISCEKQLQAFNCYVCIVAQYISYIATLIGKFEWVFKGE